MILLCAICWVAAKPADETLASNKENPLRAENVQTLADDEDGKDIDKLETAETFGFGK